jgi:LacI family transcriptional regulator, galactose operon repressor
MHERKKHTMKDVARLAAVSTSTVSAVINGSVPVSPRRKQRVLDAMTALDYHPDAIARSLKTGRSHVIGVVVPDITNAFYPEVIRGIEDTARAAGYGVLLCDSSEDPSNEEKHLSMLFSRRVDGVLLACCAGSTAYATVGNRRFPIVFLDRVPTMSMEYTVSSDNVQAGYIATRHLIDLGHERIAPIAGNLALSPHRDRLEGFRKAMQELHLPIRDEYMVQGDVQIEDGLCACDHLFTLPIPPTAIIAGNNKLLLGVLQELERRAIAIPKQVSVLGFDDYLWNRYFNPSLTAVSQSSHEIGKCSFELLLQAMKGEQSNDPRKTQIRLPTELRIRNSTAPPLRLQTGLQPRLSRELRVTELGPETSMSVRSKERGTSSRKLTKRSSPSSSRALEGKITT